MLIYDTILCTVHIHIYIYIYVCKGGASAEKAKAAKTAKAAASVKSVKSNPKVNAYSCLKLYKKQLTR